MSTRGLMQPCGSRCTAFGGNRLSSPVFRASSSRGGAIGAVMSKKGIHPEWHAEAKVIFNGVEVMTLGGTKPVYNVDIYSGNHPFYQGAGSNMIIDEGQVRAV